MTTGDNGLTEARPVFDLDNGLAEYFEDPALRKIAEGLLTAIEQIGDKLSAIPDIEPASDNKTYVLDQTKVDSLVADIVEPDAVHNTMVASELFQEVAYKTVGQKGKADGLEHATRLEDGMGALVFRANTSRSMARISYGGSVAKCKQLVDFWENNSITLSPDQAALLESTIVAPIKESLDDIDNLPAPDQGNDLTQIGATIERLESIDTTTDLGSLRFIVASAIVGIFKQKTMTETYNKLSSLDIESEATLHKIKQSPFAAFYRAAQFLKSLNVDDQEEWHDRIKEMRHLHTKGRLFKLPNREFKSTVDSLIALSVLYRRLVAVETDIHSVVPNLTNKVKQLHRIHRKHCAEDLALEARDAINNSFKAMAELQNEKLQAAGADNNIHHQAWDEGLRYDAIQIAAAQSILDKLSETNIDIDPELRANLEFCALPHIKTQHDRFTLEAQLALLKPEIDRRKEAFKLIDRDYSPTNKQYRDRQPQIIPLAKVVSDKLPETEPLSKETARALVGLILGVYWERTGQDASVSELAQQYLEDAGMLRQLSAELEYLGQKPPESKLLEVINLLDELIDSGYFDKIHQHTELQIFEDFIVAYMVAKDGAGAVNATEDIVNIDEGDKDNTEADLPTNPVPVEALNQAAYEDIKVFPPSASATDIIEDYIQRVGEKDMPSIEWERIKKLVELRDQFAKQRLDVQLIRTKHASWQVLPFFVLEVKLPDTQRGVAVVESPVYGNATYVYREADDRLPWRDAVQLRRQEARDWGAVPAVHVDSKRLDIHFNKLWNRVISELTIHQ